MGRLPLEVADLIRTAGTTFIERSHRETYCCPDPTPFSASPGYGRMKPLSSTRKLCVLCHAEPPCVLPPKKSLSPDSPQSPLTTALPFCSLPG
jgi:hypothetical protein